MNDNRRPAAVALLVIAAAIAGSWAVYVIQTFIRYAASTW